jgi:hypothetical protein
MQMGGAYRLPLVGPGGITEFQPLNITTQYGGEQSQSGGVGRLPLVGPDDQNPIRKETLAGRVASLPPPGSFFNEKMLTDPGD